MESQIQAAEVVLPCTKFAETFSFFTEKLGFRLDAIFPADSPSVAVISGYGLRLRLQQGDETAPSTIRLLCQNPAAFANGASEIVAPNGTRIEILEADPPIALPPEQQSFVLRKFADDRVGWTEGRAGMQYRDLIPNRQGGRFVASHIRILEGGSVPDYVHFHKVRFQMIYCYKGWVRVVYEDQGEPLVMRAGDCVLQPPEIRHRVLESSPGLEVIEIGCPADLETFVEHELELPNSTVNRERRFRGQRFVHHQVEKAIWHPWRSDGFEYRDIGVGVATDNLAGVRVIRLSGVGKQPSHQCHHNREFLFLFVLQGEVTLEHGEHQQMLAGDCCVIPAEFKASLTSASAELELLEVTLPAFL